MRIDRCRARRAGARRSRHSHCRPSDPVPDDLWNEAARYFNEGELAALTLSIGATNLWNRLNITTRQLAGEWVQSVVAREQVPEQVLAS